MGRPHRYLCQEMCCEKGVGAKNDPLWREFFPVHHLLTGAEMPFLRLCSWHLCGSHLGALSILV